MSNETSFRKVRASETDCATRNELLAVDAPELYASEMKKRTTLHKRHTSALTERDPSTAGAIMWIVVESGGS